MTRCRLAWRAIADAAAQRLRSVRQETAAARELHDRMIEAATAALATGRSLAAVADAEQCREQRARAEVSGELVRRVTRAAKCKSERTPSTARRSTRRHDRIHTLRDSKAASTTHSNDSNDRRSSPQQHRRRRAATKWRDPRIKRGSEAVRQSAPRVWIATRIIAWSRRPSRVVRSGASRSASISGRSR